MSAFPLKRGRGACLLPVFGSASGFYVEKWGFAAMVEIRKPADEYTLVERSRWCDRLVLPWVLCCLIFVMGMWLLMEKAMPPQMTPVTGSAISVVGVVLFLMTIRYLPPKRSFELKLMLQNVCWMVAAHILNGSTGWSYNSSVFWSLMMLAAFCAPYMLSQKERRILLNVLTVIVVLALTIWGSVNLILGFGLLPAESGLVQLAAGDAGNRNPVCVFFAYYKANRTVAATFFVIGIGLILNQCFKKKGLVWRILAIPFLPLCIVNIAMAKSRLNNAAAALCLAMAVGIGLRGVMRQAGRILRNVLVILLSLALCVCFYMGFRLLNSALSGFVSLPSRQETELTEEPESRETGVTVIVQASDDQWASTEAVQEQVIPEETAQPETETQWRRSDIWAIAPSAMGNGTAAIVFGQDDTALTAHLMEQGVPEDMSHMHNHLLQQFMVGGLPGMLIYLALVIAMLIRMMKCYFSDNEAVSSHVKAQAGLVCALLVCGVGESLMSNHLGFISFVFCLLAGNLTLSCEECEVRILYFQKKKEKQEYSPQRLTVQKPASENAEAEPEEREEAPAGEPLDYDEQPQEWDNESQQRPNLDFGDIDSEPSGAYYGQEEAYAAPQGEAPVMESEGSEQPDVIVEPEDGGTDDSYEEGSEAEEPEEPYDNEPSQNPEVVYVDEDYGEDGASFEDELPYDEDPMQDVEEYGDDEPSEYVNQQGTDAQG